MPVTVEVFLQLFERNRNIDPSSTPSPDESVPADFPFRNELRNAAGRHSGQRGKFFFPNDIVHDSKDIRAKL
jgi:hypothetical protein